MTGNLLVGSPWTTPTALVELASLPLGDVIEREWSPVDPDAVVPLDLPMLVVWRGAHHADVRIVPAGLAHMRRPFTGPGWRDIERYTPKEAAA